MVEELEVLRVAQKDESRVVMRAEMKVVYWAHGMAECSADNSVERMARLLVVWMVVQLVF